MHPFAFLHWLLGAIKLGRLKSVSPGTPAQDIILAHIDAVLESENLHLELEGTTPQELTMYNLVRDLKTQFQKPVEELELYKICDQIGAAKYGYYYTKLYQFMYYLQGAFELTNYDVIDLDQIIITSDVTVGYTSECRYYKEIAFYFYLITDQESQTPHVMEDTAKKNLKRKIERSLRTVC